MSMYFLCRRATLYPSPRWCTFTLSYIQSKKKKDFFFLSMSMYLCLCIYFFVDVLHNIHLQDRQLVYFYAFVNSKKKKRPVETWVKMSKVMTLSPHSIPREREGSLTAKVPLHWPNKT